MQRPLPALRLYYAGSCESLLNLPLLNRYSSIHSTNDVISLDQLIAGCRKMDHHSQKMIYERFYAFSLKNVFRYVYRYEKAVDVVNDGFVKFFTRIDQFIVPNAGLSDQVLMAYIKRIMINSAIDELRRRSMTPEIGGIPEYVWEIPDYSENGEQFLIYKELISLIKGLSPQYRTVFNLYVIDGYSHVEIAELLQIPEGTSKSCLSRARSILQKKIKNAEEALACRI